MSAEQTRPPTPGNRVTDGLARDLAGNAAFSSRYAAGATMANARIDGVAYAAHRGASNLNPEHTMEGYAAIVAAGARIIECDAYLLADGTLGVMHDSTVDRTTTSTGNVANFGAVTWRKLVVDDGNRVGAAWASTTQNPPPFFFDVETTASGQHGTKYMTGTVEADFLDDGLDDESDLVSTDRQEIDWEASRTKDLLRWGADITRKALREFRDRRAAAVRDRVIANDALRERLERLDKPSRDRAIKLLGNLGLLEHDEPGKELELASSLIGAFEYRQFHDVLDQIEGAEEDPERMQVLLDSMSNWKALESRAILEVIRGRISIIEKFHRMIVNDAPETAHRVGDENLHDLIGSFPWLLHPEWQVLSEERTISRQLSEWAADEFASTLTEEQRRQRYDFLALGDLRRLVLIEIKRPAYAPDIQDLNRLLTYKSNLEQGTDREVAAVFISSKQFLGRTDTIERMPVDQYSWAEIHDRTAAYYEHYRALLEGLREPDKPQRDRRHLRRHRHRHLTARSFRKNTTR